MGAVSLVLVVVIVAVYLKRGKENIPQPRWVELFARPGIMVQNIWHQQPSFNRTSWAHLYGRIGTKSRFAGLGFAMLTTALLILSYLTQFIVFEIDSIVAFLAALVLLFSEPRKRVQARVIDAILNSSEKSIAELAAREADSFEYVPATTGISGVVMMPAVGREVGPVSGIGSSQVTPPGRALAELFSREAGVSTLSIDVLEASLPQIVTENFGFANSVRLVVNPSAVRISFEIPSFECPCSTSGLTGRPGVPGCIVASFLAVLVCASLKRSLMLEGCSRDLQKDAWEVSMKLGPPILQT